MSRVLKSALSNVHFIRSPVSVLQEIDMKILYGLHDHCSRFITFINSTDTFIAEKRDVTNNIIQDIFKNCEFIELYEQFEFHIAG